MTNKNGVATIIRKYRQRAGNGESVSYRRFAEELAPYMRLQSISFQTIHAWEGKQRRPSAARLKELQLWAPPGSWQKEFAEEMLAHLTTV